jgi:hypothetical protein
MNCSTEVLKPIWYIFHGKIYFVTPQFEAIISVLMTYLSVVVIDVDDVVVMFLVECWLVSFLVFFQVNLLLFSFIRFLVWITCCFIALLKFDIELTISPNQYTHFSTYSEIRPTWLHVISSLLVIVQCKYRFLARKVLQSM